jgi:GNAT superfamily N-acetyltransferase
VSWASHRQQRLSQNVLQALNVAEEKTLVATRRGNVVGLLTLHITPVLHRPTSIGRLTALVVAEHERGKGIGRALLDAAEQFFAERGCKLVEVTSNLRLVDTHSFYKRLGYKATSLRFKKSLTRACAQPTAAPSAQLPSHASLAQRD